MSCSVQAARPRGRRSCNTHELEVAGAQVRVAAELELEQAAGDMNGTGEMAGGEFVGFAYVDQHVCVADRFVGIVEGDFLGAGLGGHDQIVGGFHGAPVCVD
jgi:hypothetical protein